MFIHHVDICDCYFYSPNVNYKFVRFYKKGNQNNSKLPFMVIWQWSNHMSHEPKTRGHQLLHQFQGFLDQKISSNANLQFCSPIFSSITFINVGMIFLSSITTLSNEKNVQAMNMRMKRLHSFNKDFTYSFQNRKFASIYPNF